MKTTKEINIDEYNLNPNLCKCCGKPIFARYNDTLANIKNKKFCNHSCSASYNNQYRTMNWKQNKKHCLVCGNELKSGKKFCSNKCQMTFSYNDYISKWKNNDVNGGWSENVKYQSVSEHIRRYLFDKYNNKCAKCGWNKINPVSKRIPLEIEHIDGNAKNNNEDNLILLCPNCHSLTSTYRGLNYGKSSRTYRR